MEKLVDAGALAEEILEKKTTWEVFAGMPVESKERGGEAGADRGGSSMTEAETVLIVDKEPPIAWFKLNRGKVHNCLNTALLEALVSACEQVANDKAIRLVAIVGAGTKVFCAGADLTERKGMSQSEAIGYLNLIQKAMRTIELLPQPVIAAINGSAFGGGTELALACDLRVMVKESSLRLTEVKLGIIPGAGGTQRLTRLIGKSKAKEMI